MTNVINHSYIFQVETFSVFDLLYHLFICPKIAVPDILAKQNWRRPKSMQVKIDAK